MLKEKIFNVTEFGFKVFLLIDRSCNFTELDVLIEHLFEELFIWFFFIFAEHWAVLIENGFVFLTIFGLMHRLNVIQAFWDFYSVKVDISCLEPHNIVFGWEEYGSLFSHKVEEVLSRWHHRRTHRLLVVQGEYLLRNFIRWEFHWITLQLELKLSLHAHG